MSDEIKSKPITPEYSDGYDRTFGKDRKPVRGKWIWDEHQQKLVSLADYRPPEKKTNVDFMVDRFYENTLAPDGTDIGSRSKHREYMKANGLTTADDFKDTWAKNEADREAMRRGEFKTGDRERRESIERSIYELSKRKRK